MKKYLGFLVFIFSCLVVEAQTFTPGWEGQPLISDDVFLDAAAWIENQSDFTQGDSCFVTADTALHLHWFFGPGSRSKFVQCYLKPDEAIELAGADAFAISVKGTKGSTFNRNVELKFETSGVQSGYTWENLAHIARYCDNLVVLKPQFSDYAALRWDSVSIISFAVTMNAANANDIAADSGVVSFRLLQQASTGNYSRATNAEPLTLDPSELNTIRQNAASALLSRQNPNGLLTTWIPDNSSWLYGQGLALRVLTEEGQWSNGSPVNAFAEGAEKLALFLAGHQAEAGYWPRAWTSSTGSILVNLEWNNTVWMGDFPWIPGSLAYYYRKSADSRVLSAISRAKAFLYNLIEPDGRVCTMNMETLEKSEVSNYEGYAAALYCLLELGDTIAASTIMDYVMLTGWDQHYQFWREGPESVRPVLLVNTWLASIASSLGRISEPLLALSLAGKLLYTCGPGAPCGFDGVGPVATWYEGTLSYIAAQGPGSNALFNEVKQYINADGSVPAYNENLGGMAGIWAVDWSSLDATSWLYFAAAQHSPFGYTGADTSMFTGTHQLREGGAEPSFACYNGAIVVNHCSLTGSQGYSLSLYSMHGTLLGTLQANNNQFLWYIDDLTHGASLSPGPYLLVLRAENYLITGKIFVK